MSGNVVILAGGTGGAKFVRGVACCVPPEQLTVVVNTGDDVTLHGLRISPDVDIITYTLAGIVDPVKGWGVAEDTFNCLEQLRRYGRAGWFNLGDRDLATHLQRTQLLAQGRSPSEVARIVADTLGVGQRVLPMTDHEVETHVQLGDGTVLHFQEYLIREGAPEDVQSVIFQNIGQAAPAAGVLQAIADADVILLAPSSPVVSIGTILSVPTMFDAIAASDARGAAVSPLMGGAPISGPSAHLMRAFGMEVSNRSLCDAYGPLIDLLVIHNSDAGDVEAIEAEGLGALVIDTMMPDLPNSIRVARTVLEALEYSIAEVELPVQEAFTAPTPQPGPHAAVRAPEAGEEEAALKVRIAKLEEALEAARRSGTVNADAAVPRAELDAAMQRIAVVERDRTEKVNAARRVVRALQNARTQAEQDVEEARAQMAELRDAVESLQREAADSAAAVAQQLAEAEAAVAHIRAELEQQAAAAQEGQEQLRAVLQERDTVRAEATAVAEARDQAQQRIVVLEDDLARLRREGEQALEEVRHAAEEQGAALRALEQETTERETMLGEEIAAAHGDRDDALARLSKLDAQLATQAALIDELRGEQKARVAEVEAKYQERIDALEADMELVMASRERARHRRREDRTKARELIRRLREELLAAQQLADAHVEEGKVSAAQVAQANRLRDEHRAKVEQLETLAHNLEAQLDAANAALAASETRVTRLQEELTALAREGRENLLSRPTPPPLATPTLPPAPVPVEAELPPEALQWNPEQSESMAQRARRRGRSPE